MKSIILFLCAISCLGNIVGAGADTHAQANSQTHMHTVLHVRGEAQLEVRPNQVTILLGASTQNKTAKSASVDNSRLMNKVISALNDIGVGRQAADKNAITTQRFGIQPVWSSRPRAFSGSEEWQSSIIAYRVNNTLKIVTAKLDLVGEIINTATTAGANQVQSINFGLSNPREYRQQAIAQAIQNAKDDAGFVAKASALTVAGIKTIHLDNSEASRGQVAHTSYARSALSSAAETSTAPPIKSDNIVVSASVTVEYFLSE
jgi:uncharacterized protein YggE